MVDHIRRNPGQINGPQQANQNSEAAAAEQKSVKPHKKFKSDSRQPVPTHVASQAASQALASQAMAAMKIQSGKGHSYDAYESEVPANFDSIRPGLTGFVAADNVTSGVLNASQLNPSTLESLKEFALNQA